VFIAIPLQHKPSWRSPPWMTALLIAVNGWVYFAWQMPEAAAVARMAAVYASTPLPAIEAPAYARQLRLRADQTGKPRDLARADQAERQVKTRNWPPLYQEMWSDLDFRQRLLAGQVIGPGSPGHAAWQEARAGFSAREPRPFTPRWSLSFEARAPDRPVTWLTSVFLHASVEHLLGNMLFLFLFGFTLEAALGPLLYLICYLAGGVGASMLAALVYAGMGGLGLGASGAISALMGMYVVLYGLRRIPFFYFVLFYFNFARWPALIMLPVWIALELAQHWMGHSGVGNMAHLGGLLSGALLMAGLKRVRRFDDPASRAAAPAPGDAARAELARLSAKARGLAAALDFSAAARLWRQAAKLAPRDAEVLGAWFDCARHEPASDDFHAAARLLFRLPARDAATRQLLLRCYQRYLARAKPAMRLDPAAMQSLVRVCVAQQQWQDAENLAHALARIDPPPQGWADTLRQLTAGLARAGRMPQARAWLPQLRRHVPEDDFTRWLGSVDP
jgi:membrane associated rhomboid family serine protease